MLAVAVLRDQGIEATGVCFSSPFYNCDKARDSARELGLPLAEIDASVDMIALIKNPPSGYGKHLNPCIDCHAMMARKAYEYALKETRESEEKSGIIIATGEVLGQRTFSQSKASLRRVEELSGVAILRPLSAKLLPETEYEKKGLVARAKLHSISGRSREMNFALAQKFGIKSYPSPAGGCLLTDPAMSERFLRLVDWDNSSDKDDFELVKNGRLYWGNLRSPGGISPFKALVVIGRNEQENEKLETLAQKGDIMIKLKEETGPIAVIRILGRNFSENVLSQDYLEADIPIKPDFIPGEEFLGIRELLSASARLTGYFAPKLRGIKAVFLIINK